MGQWKRWLFAAALVGAAMGCGDDSGSEGGNEDGGDMPSQDGSVGRLDGAIDGGALIDANVDAAKSDAAQSDASGGGTGGGDCDKLRARVRDFRKTHPDFEKFSGDQATKGLVGPMLANQLPVYTGICDDSESYSPTRPASCQHGKQTSTEANFAQWYAENDVPNVSKSVMIDLDLKPAGTDSYEFKSSAFFPLDDKGGQPVGFGQEGNPHNFHFTTEVRTSFTYKGGEEFTFSGDDDLWIFVDEKLALDLGGLHPSREGTIRFDTLGLTVGQTYRMDIFHAERHTNESNFWIRTNIQCFKEPFYQ
jgi:fibro-slime domain-containing protein